MSNQYPTAQQLDGMKMGFVGGLALSGPLISGLLAVTPGMVIWGAYGYFVLVFASMLMLAVLHYKYPWRARAGRLFCLGMATGPLLPGVPLEFAAASVAAVLLTTIGRAWLAYVAYQHHKDPR